MAPAPESVRWRSAGAATRCRRRSRTSRPTRWARALPAPSPAAARLAPFTVMNEPGWMLPEPSFEFTMLEIAGCVADAGGGQRDHAQPRNRQRVGRRAGAVHHHVPRRGVVARRAQNRHQGLFRRHPHQAVGAVGEVDQLQRGSRVVGGGCGDAGADGRGQPQKRRGIERRHGGHVARRRDGAGGARARTIRLWGSATSSG